MDATLTYRPRAVLSRLAALAGALLALPVPEAGAAPAHWEVTVALRASSRNGAPVVLRVALPVSSESQRIGGIQVAARGLEAQIVTDGPEPHVMLRGRPKGARRVAVRYEVVTRRHRTAVPAVAPLRYPPPELLPFLAPSPLFQSRSLLARDFLETNVAPLVAPDTTDLMRPIYQVTRGRLAWRADGSTLPLDVIRSGHGKRIGIERAFTTFLRCARVPARFVEGIDLASSTRRKRVFWTEVWANDRWWPVSASRGWIGRLPKSWVALTRDGRRIVHVDGPVEVTYAVQTRRVESKT